MFLCFQKLQSDVAFHVTETDLFFFFHMGANIFIFFHVPCRLTLIYLTMEWKYSARMHAVSALYKAPLPFPTYHNVINTGLKDAKDVPGGSCQGTNIAASTPF